ncbi:MAG: MBL fold metallo-hydrolase [Deltaproteobacteria bacterium]|nr:MBL fold metallo-hydrolase [Deltaproteobacteria bacterium]
MNIRFWGTRGSIASPGPDTVVFGGNTTCVEITTNSGRTAIIDAGTGIRNLGDSLLKRPDIKLIHLFMTHIHWDHLVGLPFFGPLFHPDFHVVLNGCRKCFEGLKRIFSRDYIDGSWPVRFQDLRARIDPPGEPPMGIITLDEVLVEPHRLQHPQGGLGFRFTEGNKKFVFLTDNELSEEGWDGSCFGDFVNFCQDADVLVHDCQYLPEESVSRKGWGHSDTITVAKLAVETGAKRLILFHHDPWRTDEGVELVISRCREELDRDNSKITVEAAREGSLITL